MIIPKIINVQAKRPKKTSAGPSGPAKAIIGKDESTKNNVFFILHIIKRFSFRMLGYHKTNDTWQICGYTPVREAYCTSSSFAKFIFLLCGTLCAPTLSSRHLPRIPLRYAHRNMRLSMVWCALRTIAAGTTEPSNLAANVEKLELILIQLQHSEEGFLGHLHVADLLHALLAAFLFL